MKKTTRIKSIRKTLLISTLVTSLISTALFVGATALIYLGVSVRNAKEYAASLADSLALGAIEPLLVEGYVSLEGTVDSFAQRPNVVGAFIADADGKIVVSSCTSYQGKKIDVISAASLGDMPKNGRPWQGISRWLSAFREGSIGYRSEVGYQGAWLGSVAIVVSLSSAWDRLILLIAIGVSTGLASWLVSIVLGFYFARAVSVPVEGMAENARRIAAGDRSTGFPLTSIRELKVLEESLTDMDLKLRARRAELEAARDRELKAKENAEKAATAKTALLENVSHELRTPLNGMAGILSMLRDEGRASAESLSLLEERTKAFAAIVDGMIEAAQADGVAPVLSNIPFPTEEMVQEALRVGQEFLAGMGREISVRRGQLPAVLVGDLNKLNQAVRQLLSNAAKYGEWGPVGLELSWSEGVLLVEVRDSGPGIPADRRLDVMQPYVRLEDAKRRSKGGAGLGLAVVDRIAKAYGGSVAIDDNPAGGARVVLKLKIPQGELRSAGTINNTTPDSLTEAIRKGEASTSRILLVEDEAINRLYGRNLLQKRGYAVDEAPDGGAALSLTEKNRYDLILMDIGLPDINGIEVTKTIRKGPSINALTPILAVSAHDLDADRRLCAEVGMNGFAGKPIRERELFELILSLIPGS